jgi:DNA recombination protein RmuC
VNGLLLALLAAVAVLLALLAAALVRWRELSLGLAGLEELRRGQQTLRSELQQSREASLARLGEAAQGLRLQLGQAQRTLAELRGLEQGRAEQAARSADSLRRLEHVLAGSASRGAAGESLLREALLALPADLLLCDVPFGSRVVEFALRLPDGRLLPIDSKWPALAPLARLAQAEDEDERRRCVEQVRSELRTRAREMARYLDGERTLALALLAVPDAAYAAAPEARAEGYREGVLVVPYSLALPAALLVYRLASRFGLQGDGDRLGECLQRLGQALGQADEELEGRFSRGLVQLENGRDALRRHLGEARQALAGTQREPAPDRAAAVPAQPAP